MKSKAMKSLLADLAAKQANAQALQNKTDSTIEEIKAATEALKTVRAKIEAQEVIDSGKKFDDNGDEIIDRTPVAPIVHAQAKTPETGLHLFDNFADQLWAVKNAAVNGHVDDRLARLNNQITNASGANEMLPEEGGYVVQTDFATNMMDSAISAGQILSKVDKYEIKGNSNRVEFTEIDESSVATTVYGGVQVYWASEAAAVTATKPKLKEVEIKLQKLMGIAYATYELDNDSNFTSQLYSKAFTLAIQRELESCVVGGNGAGKPLGFLVNKSLISVAIETGQTIAGGAVNWNNIVKMYNRALNSDDPNYVWLIHPDVSGLLDFLSFPVGTGGVPVYLPASLPGAVSTMKGHSIVQSDQCSAIGTVGDINYVDLSQYMLITKGGVQADSSIHVQFLTAENCFRFIFRANGQPKKNKALTIKNSSNTRSSFVSLAARS
jgi:HK97 family phage major capsid protein